MNDQIVFLFICFYNVKVGRAAGVDPCRLVLATLYQFNRAEQLLSAVGFFLHLERFLLVLLDYVSFSFLCVIRTIFKIHSPERRALARR
ncbi:hypothetical protein Caka_0584 [Coraliomargarita akajimensis DSM 45221]|uniref:Uncharacterized protein n=1 Tax=Coraliomargarita akajimensis (strain DSM 45221 / IAM 15411 / JCM 23193 / KCTC 12865 / 04OKA010-24) TaxID=583355 RepID=D5ENV0_CORAD|nr:hypothetical protein Caka_0584 [Coraliomargarita akajimensis DSM 45221]